MAAMALSLTMLQILVSMADDKTLTQIGAELYLSQSAISKAIRQTESALGLALVEQSGRRLALTPAARLLAEAGRNVLAQLATVDEHVETLRGVQSQRLQVVSSRAPASYILPTLIEQFLELFPDVQIDLDVVGLGKQWGDVLHVPYDIVVGPALDTVVTLDVEPLYREQLIFVVRRDSPFASKLSVTWRELSDVRLVGEFHSPSWKRIQSHLEHEGFEPRRRVEVHGSEVSKQLVEAGAGGAIIREALIWRELLSGYLVRVPVQPNPVFRETVFLGLRRGIQRTGLLADFRSFVVENIERVYPPGRLC